MITQGKWVKRKIGDNWYVEYHRKDGRGTIADYCGTASDSEDNARLIAAAPDLLAALEATEHFDECRKIKCSVCDRIIRQRIKAIAKARG